VYVCHSEGEGERTNIEVPFERGTLVGAMRTGLCRTATLLGFSHLTVQGSTTQMTSSKLDTTVGSIGVNMGQYPCGTLSTPCRVHDPMN
jgi:hypothetical protein